MSMSIGGPLHEQILSNSEGSAMPIQGIVQVSPDHHLHSKVYSQLEGE